MTAHPSSTDQVRTTIIQGGRRKAYRPLPLAQRRAAVAAGLAAYDAGDHFEAHELLEPAWMGSDDLVERDLVQGLIKVAAAFVHAERGNPTGVAKNLRGARTRLATAAAGPDALAARLAALKADVDVPGVLAAIDDRLAQLEASPADASVPIPLHHGSLGRTAR